MLKFDVKKISKKVKREGPVIADSKSCEITAPLLPFSGSTFLTTELATVLKVRLQENYSKESG